MKDEGWCEMKEMKKVKLYTCSREHTTATAAETELYLYYSISVIIVGRPVSRL